MIKVFVINVDELDYEKDMAFISPNQQKRVEKCKQQKAKMLALGGQLLLQYVNCLPICKQPIEGKGVDFMQVSAATLRQCMDEVKELPLETGEFGKPYLTDSPWQFNISHSGSYAVLAWGLQEVGIDIQFMKEMDADKISQRFFTKEECAACLLGSKQEKTEAFYRIWCRKEAYGKLKGIGLEKDSFDFNSLKESSQVQFTECYEFENYCMSLCTYRKAM